MENIKNIFNILAAVIYKNKRNASGKSEKVVRPSSKQSTQRRRTLPKRLQTSPSTK